MNVEERRRALKRLTKYQVFWDLKHLIKDKPDKLSAEQIERVGIVNRYRAEKHLSMYLFLIGGRYFMKANGRYRDPLVYEYSFIGLHSPEELPYLNLYLYQSCQTGGKL